MKNVKSGHNRPIVCLDAGHYGKYNRSPVVPTYYESTAMWTLHNYLATELESHGIQVIKTRTSQAKDLDLSARGRASKGADLFISLHSNACGTESVDRPVGIYLVDDNCGTIDEASKEIAALLAETVSEVMQTKDKPNTYSKLASSDRDGDGKKNDDYYGVLYGCHQVGTAGLILEHSFHTNTRAAKWLLDDANLKSLAKAEAKTLADWFGISTAVSAPTTTPEKPQNEPDSSTKYYRIRKTWEDKASQKGAYKSLENAKAVCPEGYTVFDWNGKSVYSKAVTPKEEIKVDGAKSGPDDKVAGTYVVDSDDGVLSLRAGADSNEALIETMKNGTKVRCYGFYTGKWLMVISESGNKGFCHSGYLVKV